MKYEVGILLLFHYIFREERMRKELKKEKRRLIKEKLIRMLFPRYWIRRMEKKNGK